MFDSIELREIRVFLVLADELHFGRSADRLGISQSRVSQALRTLELRIGGQLVERTSRRVGLTPLGEEFRRRLEPAYEALLRGFAETRESAIGVAGALRIGMYSPVAGGPHFVEIVRSFERSHPACRVDLLDTGLVRPQLDWLRTADVDLLVMRLPLGDPAVEVGPILTSEARVVAVAVDHPLAARDSVVVEDFAGYTVPDVPSLPREMMDAFIPPHTPSGVSLRRAELRSLPEAMVRVATGELIHPTVRSIVDHYRHPGVTTVPIRDLPSSETALVWRRVGASIKVRAFAETAARVVAERDDLGAAHGVVRAGE